MALSQNLIDQIRLRRIRGDSIKRLALDLEISKNTIRKYVRDLKLASPRAKPRPSRLDGYRDWIAGRFFEVEGNAELVRQDLIALGIPISLRQVQRLVKAQRRLLAIKERATVRFETPPGKQLQLDFGCKKVLIGGAWRMLHFLVATLGYSRRRVVFHLPNQRQASWFIGIEAIFRHFGGIPLELLVDNASPLVLSHNVETGHVEFHPEFLDFCSAWGVVPKACRPYRARTKGKVENAVKYVKRNALAGRSFACETEVAPYLLAWSHRIDGLVHGTTHEVPMVRFDREERVALLPLPSHAPWNRKRREKRVVGFDGFVMVDTVRYAVPMEHVGRQVTIEIDGEITVFIDEKEVICHPVCVERHRTIQHEGHWSGMATRPRTVTPEESTDVAKPVTKDPLCRPLAEYEAHVSLRVAS